MSRIVRRVARVAFIVAALSVVAAAQERVPANSREPRVPQPNATATPATNAQGDVNEDFELNIDERRITERDFYASTAIEAGEESARGLYLRVGVGVGASEIDVLLRNVRGRVRFHGSLEALRRVLDARRPVTTAPPEPNVP
ncbi:MAG TPA: hypothetical protein VK363_08935 [Pyrinomonadaceae bacterium]|nr:hypothetical protein [Pyrinomonadaceae bacterium]